MSKTKIFRKTLSLLILFLLCVNSLYAHAAKEPKKVIVGYYENEVFQEGAQPRQIKKGYAYEYYRKLSEYTGWEYEYKYGNFSDLYKALEKGEIDLLAGLAYTPERAEKIFYESLPMGSTRYYLLKKNSSFDINSNPASLNGKKIGAQNNLIYQIIKKWVNENKVNAELSVYDDSKELFELFDSGKLDSVIIEGNGTYERADTDAFLCVGATDYYLCVSRSRPDILAELNTARSQLNADNPNYINLLYNKYFSRTIASTAFSEGEISFLSTHNSITIGYLDNYLPYCDMDENGKLTGFLKDILNEAKEELGLKDRLHISYQPYGSFSELVKDLKEAKIDVAFPVGGGLYFSEKSGFYQSQPVINASVAVVYSGEYDKEKKPVFAVNRNNDMQYFYVKSNFPEAIILFYDSIEECLDAIVKGESDFVTINGLRVNQLLKNTKYRKLKYRLLAQTDERCFGVKIGNEDLLRLLNRGISSIGEQYILNQAYPYTDGLFHYTFSDYLKNVMFVLIPILLVLGFVISIYSIETKKKLRLLNNELKRALENQEKLITDMIRYASSEAEPDKILNQLVEYIGKNTGSDRVYVFEENAVHTFDNTYEWVKEGITAEKEILQGVPYEDVIEIWIREFQKYGQVIVKNVDEYRKVSEEIYDILKPQQIETLVAVPLKMKGKIMGFIGVDNPPLENLQDAAEFLKLAEFFFSLMIRLRNGMEILHESAVHDQLTGCKNRKALLWAYNNEYDKSQSIFVVAIDLNGLKNINDNNGHEAGDKFICRMAEGMGDVFGRENVYRMGGDEFTAVVTGKTKEEFEKLINSYKAMTGTTASVGYIFAENGEEDFSELMKKADFEMYQEKDRFYQDKRRGR